MIRSYLFVPGDSERKLSKCLGAGADAIVLDLEDSVASENKIQARGLLREFLEDSSSQRDMLWVRVNALESPDFAKDIEFLKTALPTGVVLPKSQSMDSIRELSEALDHVEVASEADVGITKILPIATETAAGVLNLSSYQSGHPRLAGLTWGAEDLSAALGAVSKHNAKGELGFTYVLARSMCLLGASAAGVPAVEGVFTDFRDEQGLESYMTQARQEGYFGGMAIHPNQVDVINRAFMPSAEEVAQAKRVIDAFAASGNQGVTSLDGKMLDIPHLKAAKKLLAVAKGLK